ncbi:SCF ubiquitin ligase complex subunit [Starmerella bacillaris]|uniref:SCF ubiquitin ligase complex subunit n=1 Tax=Starmerella bacillaris TaxID=1247836 RepID=A0AAV5RGR7_STABA|nr:SCF ubiquitin ligase complex subunit [Starmerella bacillaris]
MERKTSLTSLPRSMFPLENAATPHFLRHFDYQTSDGKHTFDESSDGVKSVMPTQLANSVSKRISYRSELEDPVPKRRETDFEDETLNAPTEEPVEINTSVVPLLNANNNTFDIVTPRSWRSLNEPSLLSPTASPRSPELASSGDGSSDSEENEQVNPAILDAPLSARAFAPTTPNEARYFLDIPPFLKEYKVNRQIKDLVHTFEQLPQPLHRYALFQLLKGCDRNTLSSLFSIVEQSLEFDILSQMPAEIRSMVLQHLDTQSVVSATQVCKLWYHHIDENEKLWKRLLVSEQLKPTDSDFQRARDEGWGYTGWTTQNSKATSCPTNIYGIPVNIYKAVYRRLSLIHQNWMRPDVVPRSYEIQSPDREVITCLDFDEDYIIASTEGKRHLNVYNTQTGELLHEFTSHDGGVWALKRVSKDIIVSGSTDHTVRVWSLSKNRCTHVFRGHHATVRCLDVVMPEEGVTHYQFPVILTGSRDTTLRLWRLPDAEDPDYDSKLAFVDLDNPYFLAELRGHEESVRAVCGHGNVAVSGSYDYKVRVWDLGTNKCRHVLEGHENKVYAAIIDPERNRCISASMDNHIKVWDLDTGAELYTLDGHTGLVGLLGLRDNILVSAAADKTLRIWNPESGKLVHNLVGHDTAILCFDHDGRRVVSGSERHLKLWDTRSGEFCRDLLTNIEHIWQVSFDGRHCVAAVARGGYSYLTVLDFDFDPSRVNTIDESLPDVNASRIVELDA